MPIRVHSKTIYVIWKYMLYVIWKYMLYVIWKYMLYKNIRFIAVNLLQ